ncbi:hypothetical protein [Paratractidigestivibacter sp.]|uniref:hypothetical protein n=1 Tax=Paratractidigestivibacter sp. TaxID=2847316 RepID=UPI002AC9F154|nr:hypothetical protein [Paratractidigestivibacter sp.]
MGNRAIITTADKEIGIYLHWNGGRDSVEAFLAYCALKGYRSPTTDPSYGFARLAQVVGNFFGGGLSVGVVDGDHIEGMGASLDNGIYILDGWDIKERIFPYEGYCDEHCLDLTAWLRAIDSRQPASEQLGEQIYAGVVSAKSD